ncbi:MAG: hypothetical protein HZB24_12830 [Desulfobacterales bacterium]|nr:hypothetical protein [Desulfobacterales bacterium]
MLEDAIKHDKLEAQQLWSALMLLIYTTAFKGDVLVSDNYCRMAEELLAQIHDPWGNDIYRARFLMAKGFRLKHSGDYEEALGVLEQALKIATHKKYHRIQAMCHQQALWYLYALGRFEEGIHRAGKALDIIDRMGFDYLFLKAWVYIDMAFNHAGLNQMERAVVLAKEAMKHFREMNYAVGQTCYHWFRCMASMKLGNMRDAEHHALSGFVVAQKHYSGQYDHELKLQKVAILIGNGDFKNAHQLLHSVHADINQSKWHVARGRYLESWLAMAQGNRKEAAARLAETLWLCEENGYDFNVLAIPFQCVPTLRELFQNGLHRDYIECILEKAGIDHGDVISKQDSNYMPKPVFSISAPNLKIHLLGKFMVSVGDRDITHQAWNGRKEQLLFKYLAYTRGTGFSKKEILMELLWPEEDPLITVKRFHVILAYLKKALEPEKQRGAPSAYIVKAGDAYMLETGKEGFIDTERFSQEFDLAKKAASPNDKLRHLLQCEALYIGDLLHEDACAQWCVEPRERFKQNYLHVLREVISIHQAERDMGACISYTNRYLATDKYAEDIYRMQMRYYSKMGNVSMVKKTYDACYDAIEKELDCHLADETKRLLAQLMG